MRSRHIAAMHPLHLTKVAVGCADPDALARRMAMRVAEGGAAWLETRFRPKRADELVGGSVYWIIKHRILVRQRILGFDETAEGRCRIRLDAAVIPVRGRPKRAHQGWRYLVAADCPDDYAGGNADALAAMPAHLVTALAELALI